MRNECLATENRFVPDRIQGRLRLNDGARRGVAELGAKLRRRALAEVATGARPETILAWHGKLVARRFDGSLKRRSPGPGSTFTIEHAGALDPRGGPTP